MKNLLARKGCTTISLHNDTWSLTLPDSNTLDLCFNSEVELCDFLEDLPDIDSVASNLSARGYSSLRSTNAGALDSNQPRQSEVPPVNVHVNLDSRDITGLLKNEVSESSLHKPNEVSKKDSDGGHVFANLVFMFLLTGAFYAIDNGGLPSTEHGLTLFFSRVLGGTALPAACGVFAFFLLPKGTRRITIGLFVSYAVFALSVYGAYFVG